MTNRLMCMLALLALLVPATVPLSAAPSSPARTAQAEDGAQERAALFAALKAAKSEAEGRVIERHIWMFWTRAPDPESQRLLDEAMRSRRGYDFDGALDTLAKLIERVPDYAEAWNQRATVLFLKGAYDRSLEAIDHTLELEPKHFGALAGKGVILMRQGRVRLAQKALRRAVAIHPWLRERSLIIEPPGRKI